MCFLRLRMKQERQTDSREELEELTKREPVLKDAENRDDSEFWHEQLMIQSDGLVPINGSYTNPHPNSPCGYC